MVGRVEHDVSNDSTVFPYALSGQHASRNANRAWFARRDQATAVVTLLAEAPVPKDRWISPDAEFVIYPPILNEESEDHTDRPSSGFAQGVGTPNPEIPGGYIALVATNNNRLREQPNSLDGMHAYL
jgi:hypothetical protein